MPRVPRARAAANRAKAATRKLRLRGGLVAPWRVLLREIPLGIVLVHPFYPIPHVLGTLVEATIIIAHRPDDGSVKLTVRSVQRGRYE